MNIDPKSILSILDRCSASFTFPMLDNGYVYLACTRLSLYRSVADWAMVIEVFGFSPRSGLPDTHIYTFASKLQNRDTQDRYVNRDAYENYLASNPNNESRFIFPVAPGAWQDSDNLELVGESATEVIVRGRAIRMPNLQDYKRKGICIEDPKQLRVFELCRYLADTVRNAVLANESERRVSVLSEMNQLLLLEDWHHPDILTGELPSDCETFQQLAQVLGTGIVDFYRPSARPNTHWRNWPDGGSL
jgi:hypothetical protein